MTYKELLDALNELQPDQLKEQVAILMSEEIYLLDECRIVAECDSSMQSKFENEYLFHETYPILVV